MARRRGDEGNAAMAFLDVFANGLGVALLLMVIFAIRLTGVVGSSTDPTITPVTITATWTPRLPPAGLGEAGLRFRLTSGHVTNLSVTTVGVEPASRPGTGSAAPGLASSGLQAVRGLTLAPGVLPASSTSRLQARLEVPAATDAATGDFDRFATNLLNAWTRLLETPESSRLSQRTEIRQQAVDYLDFVGRLATLRSRWNDIEPALGRMPGEHPATWFGRLSRARAEVVRSVFDFGTNPPPSYPSSGFYQRYFVQDVSTNVWRPQAISLDAAVTRRSWIELSSPDYPQNFPRRRLAWVRTLAALASHDAQLSLTLRVEGPGLKGQPMSVVVTRPIDLQFQDGWFDLAMLRTDAGGVVHLEWAEGVESNATQLPEPPPIVLSKPTRWDRALWEFDPDPTDANTLARIDQALGKLDQRIAGNQGRAGRPGGDTHYCGAGVDGLALSAFLARGHGVHADVSEFARSTAQLAFLLARRSLDRSGAIHQDPDGRFPGHAVYHLGFALIALNRAILDLIPATNSLVPGLTASDGALKRDAFVTALRRAIEFTLVNSSTTGNDKVFRYSDERLLGWSYASADQNQVDTSVSVVFAKAIADIRQTHHDPDWEPVYNSALTRLANTMIKARSGSPEGYRYRLSEGPVTLFSDKRARQPGCLLAEYLGTQNDSAEWTRLVRRYLDLGPPQLNVGHAHYELFYAAHLMQLNVEVCREARDAWFRQTREVLFRQQDLASGTGTFATGSANDDQTDYQQAMAVILLALPLQNHVLEAFADPPAVVPPAIVPKPTP